MKQVNLVNLYNLAVHLNGCSLTYGRPSDDNLLWTLLQNGLCNISIRWMNFDEQVSIEIKNENGMIVKIDENGDKWGWENSVKDKENFQKFIENLDKLSNMELPEQQNLYYYDTKFINSLFGFNQKWIKKDYSCNWLDK
jgi:hypothetical protein